MTLASDIASDLDAVFFTDFAVDVTPVTWGTGDFKAIFDRGYVDFNDMSLESVYITMRRADLPTSYASGDRFIIDGTDYKLTDVQYSEPDVVRVILADVT